MHERGPLAKGQTRTSPSTRPAPIKRMLRAKSMVRQVFKTHDREVVLAELGADAFVALQLENSSNPNRRHVTVVHRVVTAVHLAHLRMHSPQPRL